MSRSAFTLIELSIVLIIIGLLVGGVLAGRELIDQARQQSYIRDMRNLEIALQTFILKYDELPGDMENADDYWPDAENGAYAPAGQEGQINNYGANASVASAAIREVFVVWNHLGLAGLIDGQYPGTGNTSSNTQPGINTPLNPWGGGYTAQSRGDRYMQYTGVIQDNSIYGQQHGIYVTAYQGNSDLMSDHVVVVPRAAKSIDDKIDDGLVNSGKFMAYGGREGVTYCTTPDYAQSAGQITGDVSYDLTTDAIECTLFYRIYNH